MKEKLVIILALVLCVGCGTSNVPRPKEREKIINRQTDISSKTIAENGDIIIQHGDFKYRIREKEGNTCWLVGVEKLYTADVDILKVPEVLDKKTVTRIGCFNSEADYSEEGARNLFGGDPGIKEIVLPNTVEQIGEMCFWKMASLEKVQLSEKLKVIKPHAFTKCSNLKSIYIPASVKCGVENLVNEDNWEILEVSTDNKWYKVEKGFLLSKDGKILYNQILKTEKEIAIPEGVEEIVERVFENRNLEKVVLPSTVKLIGESAFSGDEIT